jgi:hypothetical protein
MGWNGIGWFVAVCLGLAGTALTYLYPTHREFGFVLLAIAALCFLAAVWGTLRLGWPHVHALRSRIGTARTMLLASIVGTWIFLTFALAIVAWTIVNPPASSRAAILAEEGPLIWYSNLEMEGGPPLARPVFALNFLGSNSSQKEVRLRTASIVSAKNGRKIDLEVVAQDDKGQAVVVPINEINLVPPGATIKLVAKFGDPDPNAPGKILGLESKTFLETWSQFYFVVEDDIKSYRVPFTEANLMSFFPGMVGPHITKK